MKNRFLKYITIVLAVALINHTTLTNKATFVAKANTITQQVQNTQKKIHGTHFGHSNTFFNMQNSYWTPRGQTKIVKQDDGQIDLYLNSLLGALVVGASLATIVAGLGSLPVITAFFANLNINGIVIGALSAAIISYTDTSYGIIVTLRIIDHLTMPAIVITHIKDQ